MPYVPIRDIGYRAGAADSPGVDQVSREARSRARSSTRETSVGAILPVANSSFYARSQVLSSCIAPSLCDIGGAQAAALVGQRPPQAGLVAPQCLDRCRGTDHVMQVEMRQLDVDDVLGLGVQLLAPGPVKRPFGFFHQLIVALIVPT